MDSTNENRVSEWYFGGLAAAGAACFTHPLDLLKVQMQTKKGKNISMFKLTGIILRNEGVLGLYNGISASLLRQLTYSTVRFGIYEFCKQWMTKRDGRPIPFHMSALFASMGGFVGGFAGNPADLVNVRMQNDMKLPANQRRNYKNALHGMWRVATEEGVLRLWTGASMNCTRSALMTVGQVAFYEQIKTILLMTSFFSDNMITHATASFFAGGVATMMTQPVDVIKTRAMNAKPGEVKNMLTLLKSTAQEGPLAFYKGYLPAFVRLAPHTILTFVFLEQLRINFGIVQIEN